MAGIKSFVMPPLAPPPQGIRPPGRPPGSGLKLLTDDHLLPMGNFEEPEEKIDQRIRRTFRVFDKQVDQVINGESNALIVSGAGGIGKTFGAEKKLKAAHSAGEIHLAQHNTAISAVELYKILYDNQKEGQVTMIDDCDNIWTDMEAIGILKNALDTKDERIVHWGKNSWVLNNDAIPNEFEYKGTCLFITNLDIQKMIEKTTNKFSRHWNALISRTTYLDMGIHSKREVLVRIKQVLAETAFLADHQLTTTHGRMMIDWMTANLADIRALSVRTCIELGKFIRLDDDWEDTAEVTLFKRS